MTGHSDDPMLQSFIAGQEQLAREEAEYNARVAEELASRVYDMTIRPEQRLFEVGQAPSYVPAKEPPLTTAERRGMSEEVFNSLRPELRLEIYNAAIFARNKFAKRKRG